MKDLEWQCEIGKCNFPADYLWHGMLICVQHAVDRKDATLRTVPLARARELYLKLKTIKQTLANIT